MMEIVITAVCLFLIWCNWKAMKAEDDAKRYGHYPKSLEEAFRMTEKPIDTLSKEERSFLIKATADKLRQRRSK